ncbi:MAG: protein kinase domain-containing protein [Aridibacter sp.]
MKSKQWKRVKGLFIAAREIEPSKRGKFLENACGGDEELRLDVEGLLSSLTDAESFMESPAVEQIAETIIGNQNYLSEGEQIGHYEIIEQIGAGGMGEVYLAQDTKLDRRVAIKILNERFSIDESNLQRFIQEAKSASALNHPNILVIYEIGETAEAYYIVSEFIEGKTLREIMEKSPLKLSKIISIAIQIANALNAAHTAHIIHRDIKPENIIVRPDGFVKILDFGLAKLIEEEVFEIDESTIKQNQTAKGIIMGTVNYMSPEQARGKEVDAGTDIFSFGVVMYELIARRTPFAGDSIAEIFANLLHKEPPPLSNFAKNVPEDLQSVIYKMLRKNKDERYQTMKGLLADLNEFNEKLLFDKHLEKSFSPDYPADSGNATRILQMETADWNQDTITISQGFFTKLKHRRLFAAVASVILLIGAIGFGYWFLADDSASTKKIESIAVLPFVNESNNADNEYLSDGMTESLITSLSQIPTLSVKARSSVFRYKDKNTPPQKIGRELNVQAILNGRIVQFDNNLTLHIELVDASTEKVLWKADYNRDTTDLIALQSDIARDVSQKLQLRLSGADKQRVSKSYTENTEAYQLYLKGRFYWNKRTDEGLRKSVEYFNQAIEKDPNYALAYAGLADSYVIFPGFAVSPPKVAYPQAKAAAEKALALDETLAEAHAALGLILFAYEWNAAESSREFQRAIELNPNYATAHHWYGNQNLLYTGQFDKAIAEMKLAQEIDPLSLIVNADLGDTYFYARRYDKAIEQLKKTLELDENFYYAHYELGMAYQMKGSFAEAIAHYQKARELNDDPHVLALLVHIYAASGKRSEALKMMSELEELAKERYVPAYNLAIAYAGLKENDKAFVWLEKSYESRTSRMTILQVDPFLDNLRTDPRLNDLINRVGLLK